VFCQNFDISQTDNGRLVEPEQLADIMLALQSRGCHNINLVTPTHVVPQILAAVDIAAGRGLRLPLVYNTGGYDSPEALALLDGVIDIYMPDMKYADAETAQRYSKIPNYPDINQAAVREMHRQVGVLQMDASGIATRGLLIRHLVLPNGIAGSREILRFIAEELSPDTYVNIMDQYRPAYQTSRYPELNRRTRLAEFRQAVDAASELGLWRLDRG
jgi:putative pyruvate formate lyase activating enzyme